MAGNLKRKKPDLDENIVLIQAMRDSNVPKFLSSDLPLFSALIQDLFPEIQIPEARNVELEEMIDEIIDAMEFQRVDVTKSKTLQLFETMNVRFGVMLVGPTGGGKTTIYKVLAECLKKLRQQGSEDERYQEVKYKILNPKAITMGELYGEINLESQDWVDGLASKILRKFAQNSTERRSWCIFDGPVDALWIENMNSVLDDNMMLSLMNGERIKLNPTIRILFEVMDLAVASPATVSRCGMVYLSP
jgi:dynein heavy chain, axonemal